ncbi:MAG: hypothetical protein HKN03_16465 [Acidimicrobiales bacterium]|nr:hypothetical protein [Acidimicrobiales bacterium]
MPGVPTLPGRSGERGSVALAGIAAISMMFIAFVLIAQFAVWQYGRGAVQSAANEAARASASFGADPGDCYRRFEDARGDLLGGSLGAGVGAPQCTIGGEFSEVIVPVTFKRWLPFSPDWSFQVRAISATERLPEAP